MKLVIVEIAGGVEIGSERHVHHGSDDYSRDATNVVAIMDATGWTHKPVWGDPWTMLAPGIETVYRDRQSRVRIDLAACPVLVQFQDRFEYVSYSDSEFNERATELRWTAYVRPGTSLWTRLVLRIRCQLAEWRSWSARDAFRRFLIDLRRGG
jgi:hypothetical protein